MKVSLHTSANRVTGWGHVFRLSALGEALLKRGHEVIFSLESDDPRLKERLRQCGFDPTSAEAVLNSVGISLAVVDDYEPDLPYVEELRTKGVTLVQIIDSGSRIKIPGALKVRPDPLAPNEGDLSGLRYALIADDVRKLASATRATPKSGVAVVVGGAGDEVENRVEAVLQTIHGVAVVRPRTLMPVDLVDRTAYLDAITSSAVCVCGAGTTLWECAALGVPSVALITADNQREQAMWAQENKISISVEESQLSSVPEIVEKLLLDDEVRNSMAQRGREFVDACGAARVVEFLELSVGSHG